LQPFSSGRNEKLISYLPTILEEISSTLQESDSQSTFNIKMKTKLNVTVLKEPHFEQERWRIGFRAVATTLLLGVGIVITTCRGVTMWCSDAAGVGGKVLGGGLGAPVLLTITGRVKS